MPHPTGIDPSVAQAPVEENPELSVGYGSKKPKGGDHRFYDIFLSLRVTRPDEQANGYASRASVRLRPKRSLSLRRPRGPTRLKRLQDVLPRHISTGGSAEGGQRGQGILPFGPEQTKLEDLAKAQVLRAVPA